MIKAFTLPSQFHFPTYAQSKPTNSAPRFARLIPSSSIPEESHPNSHQCLTSTNPRASSHPQIFRPQVLETVTDTLPIPNPNPNGNFQSKSLVMGAVSIGLALLILGMDDGHGSKALALGPEGPLMEEFWENVRRYALYALTVSTGVAYAVFQPIYELLKNPISAVLVIVIMVGSVYLMSQVLSAMVGVTDFSYQYSY